MRTVTSIALIIGVAMGVASIGWYMPRALWSHQTIENTNNDLYQEDSLDTKTTYKMTLEQEGVRAVYMSSWIAGDHKRREDFFEDIKGTRINAIIVDIKDDTGYISYRPKDPKLLAYETSSSRIQDIEGFVQQAHSRGIFVIGRIAVFQDNLFPRKYREVAVLDGQKNLWLDAKNLAWIDVSAKSYWDYIVLLAQDAHSRGFDEINLDYVRFPSDGILSRAVFPHTQTTPRNKALEQFFLFIHDELRFKRNILVSADVFGMTTTQDTINGVGQIFHEILPHVDGIAPMIYPSHYPDNFAGISNPAKEPYTIIRIAVQGALRQVKEAGEDSSKVRPWIQDFNLKGVSYTSFHVQEQIRALTEQGINSYFVWNSSGNYTWQAL